MTNQNQTPTQVSVIIPCYNEVATIRPLLDALYNQTYPRQAMEVVISDGSSTDGTQAAIEQWQTGHPDLRVTVIVKPSRGIPAALNLAIEAAKGVIIVRLDAHSKPNPEYVARSVATLEAGKAENVGGVWDIQPGNKGWVARSIAAAAGHPIGVGDARYRFTDQAGYVDTVPFGAFYRELLDRIGVFDETLLTNEDYEFNTRVLQSGGRIWLDPGIRSAYVARDTLSALATQYWRYGYWKVQMLRRYPETLRWRQALPPVFVAGLALLVLLSPFWNVALWTLLATVGLYILALCLAGVQLAIRKKDLALVLGVPLAIATMHFCWGTAFLWGLIHPPKSE
jgi:glycosyltransferase involved in cell wall biosynthesis